MGHSDKHALNNRTAQNLAQAILNHPLREKSGSFPAMTFGDVISYTQLSDYDEKEFWYALKHIADGLDVPARMRGIYRDGLKILRSYEKFFSATADAMAGQAKKRYSGPMPKISADELAEAFSSPLPPQNLTETAAIHAKAHESMLEDAKTLRHLAEVKLLMQALSKKPGLEMDSGRSRS